MRTLALFLLLCGSAQAQDIRQSVPIPVPLAMGGTGTGSGPQPQKATVAGLPPCNAATEGLIFGVTDALVPAALAAVASGGAVHVAVYCNGTTWIVL